MVGIGYMFVLMLVAVEVAATIIGAVGVLHTRDLGGSIAGLAYGIPTILLALAPPGFIWTQSPGLAWWHAGVLVPVALGVWSIWSGFQRPEPD